MFEKIKNSLPNFPDDVIIDWLLPLANRLNWPPEKHLNWESILYNKPLNYWQKVKFITKELFFESINLSPYSKDIITSMYDSLIAKRVNEYSNKREKERFLEQFKYLIKKGIFVKPIILYKNFDHSFNILDGHHRFLAWKIAVLYTKKQKIIG